MPLHQKVITDAHYGARESHAYWQGLPCCRSGQKTINGETYPDMVSLTEYGSVVGLKGANCRHMIFLYFPGITKLPDREFLAQQEKFGMTSNEYYQATQRQRELERRIRKTKREIAGLEQAGLGFENPTYVNKRLLLGKQQSTIKSFCKENNLVRLYEREKAYGVVAQPRALYTKRSFAYSSKNQGTMRLESLETFERNYRGKRADRVEFGMAFDKEWKDLYSEPIIGREGSIELPLPKGYKDWRKINVAHTHPDEHGGTFSPVDINAFREHRPLSTSVVANEGTYTLSPMQDKRARWIDFQNAYNDHYVLSTEVELDRLDEICRKRGYPRTDEEDNEIRNKVAKSMHIWLTNHSRDYGFSYRFRKYVQ